MGFYCFCECTNWWFFLFYFNNEKNNTYIPKSLDLNSSVKEGDTLFKMDFVDVMV